MPGVTSKFAIPYPCAGETIDCDFFASWAAGIQDAVTQTRTLQNLALNKPAAGISTSASNTIAVGVTTVINFDTEQFDNSNMVNLAVSNNRITINTRGLYEVIAGGEGFGPTTTLTSEALGILQSGTLRYRKKSGIVPQGPAELQVIGVLNCVAGDFIQANFLWTGTGGPQQVDARLQVRLLART